MQAARPGGMRPLREGAWDVDGRPRGAAWTAVEGLLVLTVVAALGGACGGQSGTTVLATSPPSPSVSRPSPVVSGPGVPLPPPRTDGEMSLEQALARRRSVRDFAAASLTLEHVAQLLWAAQGVSDPVGGRRTAPSAGALYPLEIYAVVARVAALPAGVYRYVPGSHSLERVRAGPAAASLAEAALSQTAVAEAPLTLAVTADFSRTTGKYGERGRRYVVLEAGHAAQNVCLQAVALGLGAVPIGAFSDESAARILGLSRAETLLYLLPVGEPAHL